MCWTITILINSLALVLFSSCAHTPKPLPGTPEFWHEHLLQTQKDLDDCEKDRQECEEECDATTPYYK